MGKPYSLDLRERIVAHVEAGHSARAAGRVFGVSGQHGGAAGCGVAEPGAAGGRPRTGGLRRRDLGQDGPQP
ncbi:MAG: IS630 transposase-related protein [Pseudomonadota bacterium]